MNIALSGNYTGYASVPQNFDHAEMVVKSVTYNVTPLERFTLDLIYDGNEVSVSKTPDQQDYEYNSSVLVEASPKPGYVLDDNETDWTSETILVDQNKTIEIISGLNLSNEVKNEGLK